MKKAVASLLIILSIFIWNTDIFQKNVFPKKYYEKKISKIEKRIEEYRKIIDEEALKIYNLSKNYQYEYIKTLNILKDRGVENKKAEQMAPLVLQAELDGGNKVIETFQRYLGESEVELVIAKELYNKHK